MEQSRRAKRAVCDGSLLWGDSFSLVVFRGGGGDLVAFTGDMVYIFSPSLCLGVWASALDIIYSAHILNLRYNAELFIQFVQNTQYQVLLFSTLVC